LGFDYLDDVSVTGSTGCDPDMFIFDENVSRAAPGRMEKSWFVS
jgi:hypothetical protein